MTIIDNGMLWRQLGAAIDMLDAALRDSAELWEQPLCCFSWIAPIKASVRKAEHLAKGDEVTVLLTVGA